MLGELVPALLTALLVAMLISALRTVVGEAVGLPCRYSAATPATCGVAIEVPLMILVAVVLVSQSDLIFTPGAKISRHEP